MSNEKRSTSDQILDLLLDALQQRQQSRTDDEPLPSPMETKPTVESEPIIDEPEPEPAATEIDSELDPLVAIDRIMQQDRDEETLAPIPSETDVEQTHMPQKLPSIHLEGMLGKLVLVLFLLLIVVNIPFNRFGTSLARAMPDTASLVVRDGLVIKGSGEEIYVLEN
ncbi:MAG: hypothetical protein GY943_11120, partial [Chloroflexi bacterium]|nr:hypothetical protein [Chloroflexota bacterium]